MRHWLPGGTIERRRFDRAVSRRETTSNCAFCSIVSERFDDGRGLQLHRVAVDRALEFTLHHRVLRDRPAFDLRALADRELRGIDYAADGADYRRHLANDKQRQDFQQAGLVAPAGSPDAGTIPQPRACRRTAARQLFHCSDVIRPIVLPVSRFPGFSMYRLTVTAALILSLSGSAALAQASGPKAKFKGSRDEQNACFRDANRYCADEIPEGDMKVLACLQEHRSKLSKGCAALLAGNGK